MHDWLTAAKKNMPKNATQVLIFAPRDCYPPNTGAKLRNYHLTRELARSARVSYLAFSDDASRPPAAGNGAKASVADASLPPLEEFCEQVVIVPRRHGNPPLNIVRGLVGRTPLTVLNYTTDAMARTLQKLLADNTFDFVQMEGTHLAGYLKIVQMALRRPRVLCDWHNVESELMRRYSDHARGGLRRLYARITASRIQDLEREVLRDFDAHLTVSQRDKIAICRVNPSARVAVIDNGVDVASYSDAALEEAHRIWPRRRTDGSSSARNRILFVGSMDYHANIEAITTFARDAWPAIHERIPHLTLTIVGRNPAPSVSALAELPGIEVTGTVADVRPYYFEAVASIVPLRVGGGSRLKILESMAAGTPVISSRLGAEGLDVIPEEEILLAETPAEYIAALESLADDTRRAHLARNARRRVREQYDWGSLGNLLFAYYKELNSVTDSADAVSGAPG